MVTTDLIYCVQLQERWEAHRASWRHNPGRGGRRGAQPCWRSSCCCWAWRRPPAVYGGARGPRGSPWRVWNPCLWRAATSLWWRSSPARAPSASSRPAGEVKDTARRTLSLCRRSIKPADKVKVIAQRTLSLCRRSIKPAGKVKVTARCFNALYPWVVGLLKPQVSDGCSALCPCIVGLLAR